MSLHCWDCYGDAEKREQGWLFRGGGTQYGSRKTLRTYAGKGMAAFLAMAGVVRDLRGKGQNEQRYEGAGGKALAVMSGSGRAGVSC